MTSCESLCATLAAALENLIEQDIRQGEMEEGRNSGSYPPSPWRFPDWPKAWMMAHSALSDYYKEYPDANVPTLP